MAIGSHGITYIECIDALQKTQVKQLISGSNDLVVQIYIVSHH